MGTGQTFVSVGANAGFAFATTSAQIHTFTLPQDTPAGTYAVTYTTTVNAGATTGTVSNAVSGASCTSIGSCSTDHPVGAITVTKVLTSETGSQAGTAEAGEQLTYTITLSNPTATTVTGYALTDTLSPGLSYVSSTLGGVSSGQSVNWTGLTIPANGTLQVTVTALVGAIGTVSVSNLAKPTGGTDPACPGSACVVTPTTSTVSVAKTANTATGTTVIPGQTITYTLTATVTGANTGTATVLTDTMSAGQTYVGVSSAGGFTAATVSPLVHTFTLPANTPAGAYAVSYTVTVNAGDGVAQSLAGFSRAGLTAGLAGQRLGDTDRAHRMVGDAVACRRAGHTTQGIGHRARGCAGVDCGRVADGITTRGRAHWHREGARIARSTNHKNATGRHAAEGLPCTQGVVDDVDGGGRSPCDDEHHRGRRRCTGYVDGQRVGQHSARQDGGARVRGSGLARARRPDRDGRS